MQLLPRSSRCPLISAPGDKLVLLPSVQYPPVPRQRLILIGAILPRRQHCEAPLAFLFAADKADDAVDIEGIAPLVQRPDDYIAITGFHGRSPHVPVRPPTGCALANFAPNRVFSNLAESRPPQCKACRQGGTVPALGRCCPGQRGKSSAAGISAEFEDQAAALEAAELGAPN
jgi:hypothetical protein